MPHSFSHLIGNDHIKTYLSRIVEKGLIGNSFLFAGPEGVGKSQFAIIFAKMILNTEKEHHPDLHVYHPKGKTAMHSIDSMRRFSEEVYMTPFEACGKIFIIEDADRMLPYSANALLKTFEEPPSDTVIILISSKPEQLLPTIISRCRTIRFHPQNVSVSLKQDPIYETVVQALTRGNFERYGELKECAQLISDHFEQLRKKIRQELEKQIYHDLSATQRELMEKEIEGNISLQLQEKVHELFHVILSWYRDLHLVHLNGNRQYLFLPDYEQEMVQSLQKGEMLSIEKVQKLITQANLNYERSTPLNHCLENLFLQLQGSR